MPVAATNDHSAEEICKRHDAVRLGRKKGLQPRSGKRAADSCWQQLGGAKHGAMLGPVPVHPQHPTGRF